MHGKSQLIFLPYILGPHIDLLPTTVHVYFGSVIGALPDGRNAGAPLSEGVSPVQGADRNGPTSVLKSVARMDHFRTGGTLLNQKLTPSLLANEEGVRKFVSLVRSYFRMDGHHIQFNVVDRATLEARNNRIGERPLMFEIGGEEVCDIDEELDFRVAQFLYTQRAEMRR